MKVLKKVSTSVSAINKNKYWIFLINLITLRPLVIELLDIDPKQFSFSNIITSEITNSLIIFLLMGLVTYTLWLTLLEKSKTRKTLCDHAIRINLLKEILSIDQPVSKIKQSHLRQSLTENELRYLGFSKPFSFGLEQRVEGKAESGLSNLTKVKGLDYNLFLELWEDEKNEMLLKDQI